MSSKLNSLIDLPLFIKPDRCSASLSFFKKTLPGKTFVLSRSGSNRTQKGCENEVPPTVPGLRKCHTIVLLPVRSHSLTGEVHRSEIQWFSVLSGSFYSLVIFIRDGAHRNWKSAMKKPVTCAAAINLINTAVKRCGQNIVQVFSLSAKMSRGYSCKSRVPQQDTAIEP